MSSDNTNATSREIVETLFTKSNIILLIWFLAIYLVVYILLNMFYNNGSGIENYSLRMSKIIDILFFIFLFCYILINYQTMSNTDQENAFANFLEKLKNYLQDSYSIFGLILFLFCIYLTIYFLGIPMDSDNKPYTISIIENVSYVLLAIMIINEGFKLIFGIDLLDYLISNSAIQWFKERDSKKTDVITGDSSGNNIEHRHKHRHDIGHENDIEHEHKHDHNKGHKDHKHATYKDNKKPDEVFNIRNNIYTYEDAKSVCSIYNAKLATYDQVEDSYNSGGEWCNYGWSEGQMALFPTQKHTWNKLQASDRTKNACGRPGVNGGFMPRPNLRFGVNCFGQKPTIKPADKALMDANGDIKIPESDQDRELNAKLKIWKDDPDKFLRMNSFNKKDWSEY
jgi:hypothetical protein